MFTVFNQYPTFLVFLAVVFAMVVTMVLTPLWIKFLKSSHIGQDVYKRQFEDKFEKFDRTNDLHVRLRRKLKSRAADVSIDAAGRIMISAEQREAVGIDKEVVVVGNTGYFEIWDAKRYDAVDDETDLGLLFD